MTGALVELAGTRMGRRLTTALSRGADVIELGLRPGPNPGTAEIDDYEAGLADHEARFDRPPLPAYVVRTLRDLTVATRVTVPVADLGLPGGVGDATLDLPAGTLAGQSFALPLPAGAGPGARLRQLVAVPAAEGMPAELAWSVTALLGVAGKVLWVLGWERDNLRRHAAQVAEQRRLATAVNASLDLIGTDLAVPRFPPLPYGFDPHTVALYHCDDLPGAAVAVEDFTARFPGRTAHHGVLAGAATRGVAGRYRTGIAMTDAASAVRVASSADFDIPTGRGLTAECFVRPAPDTGPGRVLARRNAAGAGWAVDLGDFGRGRPRAVRAQVFDGTTRLEAFGDVSLPVDRFTHVAAVLSRAAGSARLELWLDGRRVATSSAAPLGALILAAPLMIGPDGTGFRGVVDEVRISAVARTSFAPALGEGDEHYRGRLALFRRWLVPTPGELTRLLNETVGRVGGFDDPLVVDDGDGELARGTTVVRVVPAGLAAGETMDATGRRGISEDDLYDPDGDQGFDPVLLSRHDRPDVVYTEPPERVLLPGEPAPDPQLVQPAVLVALDALVELTAQAAAGPLTVDQAFDPRAAGAHPTGRAVLVRHLGFDPARLAALAHRAGFDFVRRPPRGPAVYCSCAPGALVSLVVGGVTGAPEVTVGQTATVTVRPALPVDATVRFMTIPLGPGRATVAGRPDQTATLRGTAPGQVVAAADVTRGGRTVSASTTVLVRPGPLADGAAIAADGRTDVDETVVGPPEPVFDPRLLVRHDDPRVDYGPAADNRRMQPGVARRLTALLDRLGIGTAGSLRVISAFRPAAGDPDLASRGRALTVRHVSVVVGELAAAAHAAGFGFVRRSGTDVLLRHQAEPLVTVSGPAELAEGAAASFTAAPDPATLSAGTRLGWSTGGLVGGRVSLASTTRPTVTVAGERAGRVWLQAALRDVDALTIYQFEVRLRPELVAANATLTRDQYDLIMNVLHALHPVGVEVVTRALREAVVELRGESLDLDPSYTYPRFRLHGSAARLPAPHPHHERR